MKKIIVILFLILSFSSCQTIKNLSEEEVQEVDILGVIDNKSQNRTLSKSDEILINEFTQFAIEGSDIMSYRNRYNFSSLYIQDDKNEGIEQTEYVLNSFWGVHNRAEYMIRLKRLFLSGLREDYIRILELLLTKQDSLNSRDEILNLEIWQDDIDNELMTLDEYYKIVFLISRGDFISYKDIQLFELERLSMFLRWGVSIEYLSYDEARFALEDVALEMATFDADWYKWGSSYVAGLTMLWFDSRNIETNIRDRSLCVMDILENYSWSRSSWERLRELSTDLTKRKVLKSSNIFEMTVRPPKLPKNWDVDSSVAILFDYTRDSESYIGDFTHDYNLYKAIKNQDSIEVKKILKNNLDAIWDSQLGTGCSFVYEAVKVGNINILRYLLDSGFDPNICNTGNRWSPLHLAIEDNNFEMCKLLLENSANANLLTKSNTSQLGFAISDQNEEITNLLLEYGSNPLVGIYNKNNRTYWGALVNDNKNIVTNVIKKIEDSCLDPEISYNDLLMLVEDNKEYAFNLFSSKSSDLEYRIEDGNHILYKTLGDPNYYWAADILMDRGYTLEIPGYNNFSILSLLASNDQFNKILEILDRGFDITGYDYNNGLPVLEQMFKLIKDKESNDYKNFIVELKNRGIEITKYL